MTAAASTYTGSPAAVAVQPPQIRDCDTDYDSPHFDNHIFHFGTVIDTDCRKDSAGTGSGTDCDTHCFVTHAPIHCTNYNLSPPLPAVTIVLGDFVERAPAAVADNMVVVLALL